MDPVSIGLIAASAAKPVVEAAFSAIAQRKANKEIDELDLNQVSVEERQQAMADIEEQARKESGSGQAVAATSPGLQSGLAQSQKAMKDVALRDAVAARMGARQRDLDVEGSRRYGVKKDEILRRLQSKIATNLPGAIMGGAQEGLAATKKIQDDEFMKGAIDAGKLVGREVEAGRVPTPAEAAAAAVGRTT